MSIQVITTELAPKAQGTYSQGVKADGFFYFSGQIGINPKTQLLKTSFTEQLEQIMDNIDGLLKSQNLQRKNIIKTTVFLTNLNNFKEINEAYSKFFNEVYPARSCVEVSALPLGALVEIEVIATEI